MTTTNISTNNKYWWGCGERGTLLHCWWECRLVQPWWKAVWRYLKKLKMELPYAQSFHFCEFIWRNWNTSLKEHTDPDVHCSIIYNCQDLETAQVPISRWVGKKVMVHLHNGILLGPKKEGNLILCNSMDGPGEYCPKWNNSVRERQVPYDFICMWKLMNKIR